MAKLRIFIAAVLLMPSAGHAFTAYLEPPKIFEGDIARLIIEYENDIPSLYSLDTALLESDFEVLDAQSRIYRKYDPDSPGLRMQWAIQIAPRRTGMLTVPSLQLGGKPTPVLELEVMTRSARERQDNNVFVEILADPPNPYVGQQTRINLRLFSNVPLSDGKLSEPEAADSAIYRGARDHRYTSSRDGERFQVLERSLSLFARQPGELPITAVTYRGHILGTTGRRIIRKSERLKLRVRSPPSDFDAMHWIPAEQLEITQRWEKSDRELAVGDSLGRTLNIVARGLAAEALPADLLVLDSEQFKSYPDEALRDNTFDGATIVGQLQQSFVLIPSQPGELEIPELRLRWWDVNSDQVQLAVLPGRRIQVVSAADDEPRGEDSVLAEQPGATVATGSWLGYGWLGLIPLALLTLLCWPLNQGTLWRRLENRLNTRRELHAALARVKHACQANDPQSARSSLLVWARLRWPGEIFYGLFQLNRRLGSSDLARELALLDAALYHPNIRAWQGRMLWRILIAAQPHRDRSVRPQLSGLPQLYPG